MKVAVVGSGLAAAGAIRALLKAGHRPVVLDIGHRLPKNLIEQQKSMSSRLPGDWSHSEWAQIARNEESGRVVPRKLVFGSNHFYSPEQADITKMDSYFSGSPPWSPARGGFSTGWGAAVLPPAPSDVAEWPVTHAVLLRHMREVLSNIPISEPIDEISGVFGQIRPQGAMVLPLSPGQTSLLARLNEAKSSDASLRVLVGQSRLLTQAESSAESRCRFCGHCSSGCVYGSIYTAEQDFDRWISEDRIDYRSGISVFELRETGGLVQIHLNLDNRVETQEFDVVFLAAGAVNSARILLNSSPDGPQKITLRRTGGALQIFATLRPLDVSWPEVNTQASHFVEINSQRQSPFWAHVQIGQPNELVLRRLGLSNGNRSSWKGKVIRSAAEHIISAALNVHSDFGPTYEMKLQRQRNQLPTLQTCQHWTSENRATVDSYSRYLKEFLRTAKFYQVPLARQDSAAAHGYHFGSSFPMQRSAQSYFSSDSLGRPFGWRRVHVVDTSVLPAIPATTVGLLTMANAHRIASEFSNVH